MYAQVEKSKENKSRAVGNSVTQQKNSGVQGVGFVDNRPEAGRQSNRLELTSNNNDGFKILQNAQQETSMLSAQISQMYKANRRQINIIARDMESNWGREIRKEGSDVSDIVESLIKYSNLSISLFSPICFSSLN